jgi:large subunit ribosomal protein L28
MSKRCDICGQGPTRGAKRSHSNRQTLKRQYLNLQSAKLDGDKVKLCARCLKTSKKPAKAAAAAKAKVVTAKKK